MEPDAELTGTTAEEDEADDSAPQIDERESRRRSRPIDHPELGAGVALLDDRGRTMRGLRNGAIYLALGVLGVVMGVGDATSGDQIGLIFGIGGLILVLYGVYTLATGAVRFMTPIRIVVAERGFAYAGGPGQIDWGETSAVDFVFEPRETEASSIGVKVREPEEFAERHAMAGRARAGLLRRGGWLRVGGGTAMPLEDVFNLIEAHVPAAPARPAARNQRHSRRTSRH
jgi:hypothetical protein